MTIEEIHDVTTMDVFFLHKFQNIIDMEKELAAADKIDSDLYIRAKKMGFLDKTIEQLLRQGHFRCQASAGIQDG